MVEVTMDLWRSSCPTSLLKQGHLKALTKDHIQMAFEDRQGMQPYNMSGQPVSALSQPHSEKIFPVFIFYILERTNQRTTNFLLS